MSRIRSDRTTRFKAKKERRFSSRPCDLTMATVKTRTEGVSDGMWSLQNEERQREWQRQRQRGQKGERKDLQGPATCQQPGTDGGERQGRRGGTGGEGERAEARARAVDWASGRVDEWANEVDPLNSAVPLTHFTPPGPSLDPPWPRAELRSLTRIKKVEVCAANKISFCFV